MRKIIFVIIFVFVMALPVYAHSGRTDENGCHCCYTEECYKEYHCHNNGKKYIPEKKKVCPGPGQKAYYPKETEEPSVVTKNATTQKDTSTKEEENNTDFGGLIIGALGGSLGTVLIGRKKNR